MHSWICLTLSQHSDKFVETEAHDTGTKWSLSALKTRLLSMGIDEEAVFKKIHDLIIKTLLSIESQVVNAMDMFVPFPTSNCFELFGFDVLIDEELNAWLLVRCHLSCLGMYSISHFIDFTTAVHVTSLHCSPARVLASFRGELYLNNSSCPVPWPSIETLSGFRSN